MNTPSFNSRATAQMAMKALLRVLPDLDLDALHGRVVAGDFDTGRNLRDYPTAKLEGKRMAVLAYGNIGREVAKLARAFGMNVAVHARERHREWIESEGFEFAETAEQAARDAEAITVHTGLGTKNPETGRFANAGFVGASILNALKPGAVVINFDRGEVVDPAALDEALANGRVGYVSVDADVFKDPATGALTGPLAPYIGLEARHKGKLQLLPHAAADTDHPSRVEGARQAVDQIMDVIRFKSLTNVKGTVPDGYTDAGGRTVPGVGAVSAAHLKQVSQDAALVKDMKEAAESMAAIWGALSAAYDTGQREELIRRYGAALTKAMNRYAHMAGTLGLQGPFS
jgi:lactate dehydrogenase-like 2-hydroxyacid dehydrogenase